MGIQTRPGAICVSAPGTPRPRAVVRIQEKIMKLQDTEFPPRLIVGKPAVVAALRERGQHMRADWVDRELPDLVDATRHTGLFATLGIDPADLPAVPADQQA